MFVRRLWIRANLRISKRPGISMLRPKLPRRWRLANGLNSSVPLKDQCEILSRTAIRHRIECESPDDFRMLLNRISSGLVLRAVTFRLDPVIPAIFFESNLTGDGLITFHVLKNDLSYKIGNRGLVL